LLIFCKKKEDFIRYNIFIGYNLFCDKKTTGLYWANVEAWADEETSTPDCVEPVNGCNSLWWSYLREYI